jgi:2-polyprenyl-3-methyl-5-hydroxy-6-metoxy-1,4-benzoquinol methylase
MSASPCVDPSSARSGPSTLLRTAYEARAGKTAINAKPRAVALSPSRISDSAIRYDTTRLMTNAPTHRVPCPICESLRSRHERIVAGFELEKCERCGHVFMNPQYSSAQIAELYTDRDTADLTAIYSRIAASESVRLEYLRKLDLLESVAPSRGRLLDFACGSGAFFEVAQSRGWDAHGSELGEWARHAAQARGLKNLHIGSLTDLQFESDSFDVVYAAQVFEHLSAPKNELSEIKRILKPDGLLYVDVPNYRTLSIVLNRDDFMLNEPPQHVNYFTSRALTQLLSSAGFLVTQVGSGGGLKWENLMGRTIKSDIAKAYGLGTSSTASRATREEKTSPGFAATAKSLVVRGFVKPILYDRLKFGMVLFALARRPAHN